MAKNNYSGNSQPSEVYSLPASEVQLPQYFLVRPGTNKHTTSGTVTTAGPMVPLVPVDQLPDWIDIVGVPRELQVGQARGLCNLGRITKDTECYNVRVIYPLITDGTISQGQEESLRRQRLSLGNSHIESSHIDTRGKKLSSTASRGAGRDAYTLGSQDDNGQIQRCSSASSRASSKGSVGCTVASDGSRPKDINNNSFTATRDGHDRNNSDAPRTTERPITPMDEGIASPPTAPAAHLSLYPSLYHPAPFPTPAAQLLVTLATGVRVTPSQPTALSSSSSSARPAPRNKGSHNNGTSSTYCRHWCHHGTCKWGPVCRYQHVMPSTSEGLREVGLAGLPAWWKAAMSMAFGIGGLGVGTRGWLDGGGAVMATDCEELRKTHDRLEGFMGSSSGGGKRETRRKGKKGLGLDGDSFDHDIKYTRVPQKMTKEKDIEEVLHDKLVDV